MGGNVVQITVEGDTHYSGAKQRVLQEHKEDTQFKVGVQKEHLS